MLASCASAPECPAVDETALRARIREEVLAEIDAREQEQARQHARDMELPGERLVVGTAAGPARGAREPLVTIVTFSDFQCPFCSRVVPTLERLLEAYPNEVQLVFRNNPLPFHQHARPAAELALEAYDQGGSPLFWRAHDLLFENQRSLERSDLERYGGTLGMNVDRLREALDRGTHRARIDEDMQVAAARGARGTPAFFINGLQLMGAQPFDRFDEIVREEIELARALLEAGVPRGELYARFQRDARSEPPDRPEVRPRPSARRQPDPGAIYRVPVDGRPQRGRADALVTIVEFADFQCPFCGRVQTTLEQIRSRYGNDVRLIYRHNPLPFHQQAMPAAEAAEEVRAQRGDAAFYRYSELLWENQRSLERANLLRFAQQVGANPSRVEQALDDHRHQARIREDQRLAQSLGASGTPAFFVNGRNLRGAQPFAAFETLIDEVMQQARQTVQQGTPRERVYEATIASGATSPQLIDP